MSRSVTITDIGKRRRINQDYVFASDEPVGILPNLYVVADGMGGHKAGDYASRFTVKNLVRILEIGKEASRGLTPEQLIETTLREVNSELRRIAASDENYYGMGTTIVVASVEGSTLRVWNVGDSRLYILSDRLHQITKDHSLVEEMVEAGSLTESGARRHPDRNVITRAIGAEDYLLIDCFTCTITDRDMILMCTDGLTNMLEDSGIEEILREDIPLEEKAARLVDEANRSGGRDNVTVLLADSLVDTEERI